MPTPDGESAVEATLTDGVLPVTLPKKGEGEEPGGVSVDAEETAGVSVDVA